MRIFIKIDREVESRERVALLQHTFRKRDRQMERKGYPNEVIMCKSNDAIDNNNYKLTND